MLPEVEGGLPDTIGMPTIVWAANASGIFLFVVASALGLPDARRDKLGKTGVVIGFAVGLCLYLTALLIQLLCRQ